MSRRVVVKPRSNNRSANSSSNQQTGNQQMGTQQTGTGGTDQSQGVLSESTPAEKETSRQSRTGSLSVSVKHSETAQPVEGASVRVSYPSPDGGFVTEKNTDQMGKAYIENLTPTDQMEPPNKQYQFVLEKPGFNRESVSNVDIVPEETTERTVELRPSMAQKRGESNAQSGMISSGPRRIVTGRLRVQVRRMDDSAPIEDASVTIYKVGTPENVIREVKTDASGRTAVIELAATNVANSNATYRIVVTAKGYESAEINQVDIEPNETIVENIYLGPALYSQEQIQTMETAPPSSQIDESSDAGAVTEENQEALPIENPELPSETGRLRVDVTSILRDMPISGATVRVFNSGETATPLREETTDVIGRTPIMELPAPNIDYSLTPSVEQPYANYDLLVEVPGFESVEISNIEILPDVLAIQNLQLIPLDEAQGESAELFVIPPHTLYGDYPPKIAEAEIKPVGQSGEIVLSRVVIPEYVVVHDGPPSDTSAANYYVKYRDYIKNVASSEIYATWPEATIMANVLCIQSFVLNRVYTEWYRNRGYQFTITNSTAYDQKFIPGRNIFDSISEVVDQVFASYVSRPNIEQPLFTQFCDGRRVNCPNWLSQWGSKALGDQGYSAIDILRNYYGNDVYIATAEEVSGVPSSWPGADLEIGSRGDKVRQMQRQLNVISNGYPLIPKIAQDGVYGAKTAEAVKVFQQIFDLPQTGVVDFPTWYKISEIYVGVSRIAELN